MQTIEGLEPAGERGAELRLAEPNPARFDRFQRRRLLVILLTFLVGLAARVYRLDASGFAEDEVNKLFSARAYKHGDFTVNSEHPMLMKLLCFSSIELCRRWNSAIGPKLSLIIADETALRLPNAVAGALTVVPLFLLANALFGFRTALITACLWAIGGNAIWFNRITKEDTLMVFFMLSGFAIYNNAKTRPAWDVSRQEALYGLAGIAFGLMLSSKYFPHYYGLLALFYHLAGHDPRDNRALTRRMKVIHLLGILLALCVFDFAILLPDTWAYLWRYVHGDLFTHHGYVIMDRVYPNSMARTPNGSPWFLYWLYLLVKVPLPILAAFLTGAVVIFTHRRAQTGGRGYLFLRIMLVFWLFPMSFMGVKFLRYTLALIPFVYMTTAVGAVFAWHVASNALRRMALFLRDSTRGRRVRGLFPSPLFGRGYGLAGFLPAVAVLGGFVLSPGITMIAHLPYPALYTNILGAGRVGYFFPHDEFYDLGARESIKYIAENAPPGALVATEVPAVLQYYLERYGRTDIESETMSHPRFDIATYPPDYVLIQPGRVYFENEHAIRRIESEFELAQSSEYGGAPAARVYRRPKPRPGTGPLTVEDAPESVPK